MSAVPNERVRDGDWNKEVTRRGCGPPLCHLQPGYSEAIAASHVPGSGDTRRRRRGIGEAERGMQHSSLAGWARGERGA